MRRIPPLPLTREHGSWAVMAVPLIVGTAASDRLVWDHLLLIIAAVAAFLAYVPAQILLAQARGRLVDRAMSKSAEWWFRLLAAVALGSASWLAMTGGWSVLLWGVAALLLFAVHHRLTEQRGKSLCGDFVASVGLSAGAPAAFMVGAPTEWSRALLLWVLVVAFFGSSVVYVHMKIRWAAAKVSDLRWYDRLRFGWVTIVYHVAIVALVAAIVVTGRTGILAVVAYVPMTIHAVAGTLRLAGRVSFKRLGFLLLGHSILFALLMAIAWRNEA